MKILKTAKYKQAQQMRRFIRIQPSDSTEGLFDILISNFEQPWGGGQVLIENLTYQEAIKKGKDLERRWEGYELVEDELSGRQYYDQWLKKNREASKKGKVKISQVEVDRKKELAIELLKWHEGQWSSLYELGSSWIAGEEVPNEVIQVSISELEDNIQNIIQEPKSGLYENRNRDIRELRDLQNRLRMEL